MSEDEVRYEWNEAKRLKTIEKHGIDFTRAVQVFLGPHVETDARSTDELRRTAIGKVGDHVIAVIFTRRGSVVRIITARRARRNEREDFRALYNSSNPENGGSD